MSAVHPDQVLPRLGLRADKRAGAPAAGMSGSTITRAVTDDGEPVVVKVSVLDSEVSRDQADRELAVYTQLAAEQAIPTPRLIAHHRTAAWTAIALAHHDPAPPAPGWSTDDWCAFARVLGCLHRTVRSVPKIFHRPPPVGAAPRGGAKNFAERLWHGPGDAGRLRIVRDDLPGLEAAARSGPASFLHGDCHLGNVLHTAHREPVLVDWQSARVGPSAADLAFALTRAVPTGAAIPRDSAVEAYCDETGSGVAEAGRQITAHQILILVRQYPEFSAFLDEAEVGHLRRALDDLLSRWRIRR